MAPPVSPTLVRGCLPSAQLALSRTYMWPPLSPWLLVRLQLYMVSTARPFPAFMHRVSLLVCFCLRLAFSLRCLCFDRTLLLHNSDPSTTRNPSHLLLDCSLFRVLISSVHLFPFPSFETSQKNFFLTPKKQVAPYP